METPLDRLNKAIQDHCINTAVVTGDVPHVFKHEGYKITISTTNGTRTLVTVQVQGHAPCYMNDRVVVAEDRNGQTFSAVIKEGVAELFLPNEIYFFAIQVSGVKMGGFDSTGDLVDQHRYGPLA